MAETSFEREVRDRLISIETKQDTMIDLVNDHAKTISQHDRDIVRIDASTKSAHHRIDGICATAGLLGGFAAR